MEDAKQFEQSLGEKHPGYRNGKFYFDKRMERNVFFVLTLAMLLWGAVTKICQVLG